MSHGVLGDEKSRISLINLIGFEVFWIQLPNLHFYDIIKYCEILRDFVMYGRAGPVRTGPHAGPSRAIRGRAGRSGQVRAGSGRAGPSRVELGRAGPGWAVLANLSQMLQSVSRSVISHCSARRIMHDFAIEQKTRVTKLLQIWMQHNLFVTKALQICMQLNRFYRQEKYVPV